MTWVTKIHYKFENMRGEEVEGKGEIRTAYRFPDLAEDTMGVLKHIERHSHDLVKDLFEYGTTEWREGFSKEAKAKGWKMKDIAERWGVTPRQMSNIAAKPSWKDWDALDGLPNLKEA